MESSLVECFDQFVKKRSKFIKTRRKSFLYLKGEGENSETNNFGAQK